MKIILGSKSFWRQQVLKKAGYDFEVMVSNIDENSIRSSNFEELPILLARAKAKALLKKIKEDAILITSDLIVICNGQLREKPQNEEEARLWLKSYNKYPAQTNTAVVVTNTKTRKQVVGLDIAKVYFKKIPLGVIEKLIKEGRIFNASGAFIVEDQLLSPYVDYTEGSIDSITGLPLKLTEKLMKEVVE